MSDKEIPLHKPKLFCPVILEYCRTDCFCYRTKKPKGGDLEQPMCSNWTVNDKYWQPHSGIIKKTQKTTDNSDTNDKATFSIDFNPKKG
ncbi:unnamed protein product [marine sediment metagenome]|uniref:Uncharacterized protein n=1 Tax=marine sediment metagenome TaxID=412755 RepID=X0RW53_9ZZZZ